MKLRLGQISYTNVLPVSWGFREGKSPAFLDITSAPPSTLNHMMAHDMLDMSPVSSISYAHHFKDWVIVPGLSVASRGRVMSVLLLSHFPLRQLSGKRVVVTKDSETSVELLRLCFQREGISSLLEQKTVTPSMIQDPKISGILAIGDLALGLNGKSLGDYKTDLGLYWEKWTGKPFVYALWAVRKKFAEKEPRLVSEAIAALNLSCRKGLNALKIVSAEASKKLDIDTKIMETYFKGLSYGLDQEHEEGLLLFFNLSRQRGFLKKAVTLEYFAI